MSNPNAFVDGVGPLSAAPTAPVEAGQQPSGFVAVSFQSGRGGLLDMSLPRSTVWAEVLDSLRQSNLPAYVEIDPATDHITELLCPLRVRVGAVSEVGASGDVEVELVISQARHYLRRSNPDFQGLLESLRTAHRDQILVLVTEKLETHEIIDVRPAPDEAAPPTAPETGAAPLGPGVEMAPVTPQRANELFSTVNAQTCCPASAAAPCIPFLYPDDGCWGRAHEMCRLMINAGAQPNKIWIYGSLRAATTHNPNCRVLWGWHVAPTLEVSTGSGAQVYVIDPSLFNGPVPQATWASVQGDPAASLQASSAAVFYRNRNGSYVEYDDAAYSKTRQVLETYRNQLKLRSVGTAGPPPYLQCLSKPAGVQWYGTISPNATGRWFTYGWPATWHVVWTVMPLTPCPKGPQLSWTVQVERANATQCTYWITVRNLTADPVRFEGRFDVLSR